MQELIKIQTQTINDEMIKTVNARELHRELGVGRDFSTWIKSRLETLGSVEGEDYITLTSEVLLPKSGEQRGGHNRLEYFVTLDIAKHLAMMEKNEVGKKVREYFIQCEKELREISTKQRCFLEIIEATDQQQVLLGLNKLNTEVIVPLENKVTEQAQMIKEQAPKVEYCDMVLSCPDLVTISVIAHDYGMSARKMNKLLADRKVQYKNQQNLWVLYARYLGKNYARLETVTYEVSDGNYRAKHHLKWTQKGRLFLYDLLKKDDILPTCEQDVTEAHESL